MLFPRSSKNPVTLFFGFGFARTIFLVVIASGGGVLEVVGAVGVGAVTTGVVVPEVADELVAAAELTFVRSGLGAAVPSTVAGAGVLGVALAVPVVVDAEVVGVTVPAGVRVDGLEVGVVVPCAVPLVDRLVAGTFDKKLIRIGTPLTTAAFERDITVFDVPD